jgi:hypothetical protein
MDREKIQEWCSILKIHQMNRTGNQESSMAHSLLHLLYT